MSNITIKRKNFLEQPLLNGVPILATSLIGDSLVVLNDAFESLDTTTSIANDVLMNNPEAEPKPGDLLTWNGKDWIPSPSISLNKSDIPQVARSWVSFAVWTDGTTNAAPSDKNVYYNDKFNVSDVSYAAVTTGTTTVELLNNNNESIAEFVLLSQTEIPNNLIKINDFSSSAVKPGYEITGINIPPKTKIDSCAASGPNDAILILSNGLLGPLTKTNSKVTINKKEYAVAEDAAKTAGLLKVNPSSANFDSIEPGLQLKKGPIQLGIRSVLPNGAIYTYSIFSDIRESSPTPHYQVTFTYPMPTSHYVVLASAFMANYDESQPSPNSVWNYNTSPAMGKFVPLEPYDLTPSGYKLKWQTPTSTQFAKPDLGTIKINSIVYGPALPTMKWEDYPGYLKITSIIAESGGTDRRIMMYSHLGNAKMSFEIQGAPDSIFHIKVTGGFGKDNSLGNPYEDGKYFINTKSKAQFTLTDLNSQCEIAVGAVGKNTDTSAVNSCYWRWNSSEPSNGAFLGNSVGPYVMTICDIIYGCSWRFKFRPPTPSQQYSKSHFGYFYEVDKSDNIIEGRLWHLNSEYNKGEELVAAAEANPSADAIISYKAKGYGNYHEWAKNTYSLHPAAPDSKPGPLSLKGKISLKWPGQGIIQLGPEQSA